MGDKTRRGDNVSTLADFHFSGTAKGTTLPSAVEIFPDEQKTSKSQLGDFDVSIPGRDETSGQVTVNSISPLATVSYSLCAHSRGLFSLRIERPFMPQHPLLRFPSVTSHFESSNQFARSTRFASSCFEHSGEIQAREARFGLGAFRHKRVEAEHRIR